MMKFWLLLLLLIPSLSLADEPLPDDSNTCYISTIGDVQLPDELKTFHIRQIEPGSPIFNERYATGPYAITALPAIRVQAPDGVVLYQAQGNDVPNQAELCKVVKKSMKLIFWRHKKASPKPEPEPKPDPLLPVFNAPVEDSGGSNGNPIYVVLAFLAGIGIGIGISFLKQVKE